MSARLEQGVTYGPHFQQTLQLKEWHHIPGTGPTAALLLSDLYRGNCHSTTPDYGRMFQESIIDGETGRGGEILRRMGADAVVNALAKEYFADTNFIVYEDTLRDRQTGEFASALILRWGENVAPQTDYERMDIPGVFVAAKASGKYHAGMVVNGAWDGVGNYIATSEGQTKWSGFFSNSPDITTVSLGETLRFGIEHQIQAKT